jgi:hypothetical protein
VVDAASIEGFYKSIKYGVRRYPAVIVDGRARFIGSHMLPQAGEEIACQLASQPAAA